MRSRTKARKAAVDVLYASKVQKRNIADIVSMMENVRDYSISLLDTYEKNEDEIDLLIEKYSVNWKISRISMIDKCILEVSIAEIISDVIDIPIIISQAVILARSLSTEKSYSYINGVLRSIAEHYGKTALPK